MPLVYAQVARAADGAVLSEHTTAPGAAAPNFPAVVAECLARVQRGPHEDRFTVAADGYNINFLVQGGYVFAVVADEGYGREVPFACAKRAADAWGERYWERGRTAAPGSLTRAFGPTLQREMDHCMAHPEEAGRMAAVQRKVDEVKNVMTMNVQQVGGAGVGGGVLGVGMAGW
jgi:vesicle-associated membrane protein 72